MGLFINKLVERNPDYVEVAKTNRNLIKDIFEVSRVNCSIGGASVSHIRYHFCGNIGIAL